MSKRSLRNKTKKSKSAMVVAIVAIILIIIAGITNKQRDDITIVEKWIGNIIIPVQNVFSSGVNKVEDNIGSIAKLKNLQAENEELREEVESLNKEILDLSMSRTELEELKKLKYALNYIEDDNKQNTISASLIGKEPGNWFNMFTINAGEDQGLKKDSIVLNSNGLIGRVYETGNTWAKVISIIDSNSSVSFEIMRDNSLQGIVTGNISNEITGYLFDPLADVIVGDSIITSGMGTYPKGIKIGEVVKVDKTEDNLLKTIKVEPSVDFRRITKVLIIE